MVKRLEPSESVLEAEAAVWVARLGYEGRTQADEAAFRAWIDDDVRHREAFEAASATWQLAAALKPSIRRDRSRGAPLAARRRLLAGGLAAAAGLAGVGVWAALESDAEASYATTVGEQRRIALADGSLMILDSNTSVQVRLSAVRRSIILIGGRAHFDVAKDPMRPFIVRAAERQVVAVGTAFDVSRTDADVTVLLVEGRVAVEPTGNLPNERRAMMSAGDRMVFGANGVVRNDRPDMAKLTAWQNGRLVFDKDTLASAVAQMNRYSRRPLTLGDRAVGELLISGIYSAGDVEAFATSISMVLPVEVLSRPSGLTLVTARSPGRANSN
jgi:transmembrane sensor